VGEFEDATKQNVTEGHSVIGEAIHERDEGYMSILSPIRKQAKSATTGDFLDKVIFNSSL
jgi:hypothetical protein